MKKKIYLLTILLLCFCAINSNAAVIEGNDVPLTKEIVAKMTPEQKQQRLQDIKARMTEIESVDRSKMSKEDRKALREEMRSLRHDSSAVSGGSLIVEVGGGVVILVLVGLLTGV